MVILRGHTNYIMCVDYNPKLDIVATGSFDESVRIWSCKDGKCLKTLPAHSDPITSVQFHPTGTLLLTASYDGVMYVWHAMAGLRWAAACAAAHRRPPRCAVASGTSRPASA